MVKIYTFFQTKVCDLNLAQKTSDFFNDFDHIFIEKHIFLTSFSLKLSLLCLKSYLHTQSHFQLASYSCFAKYLMSKLPALIVAV